MSVLVERRVRLRDDKIVLFIRGIIPDLVRHDRILRIGLVHKTVGRLDEAVRIEFRIAGQRVDQTDVRAFRRLDRAHSAVVRIMDVADFEACAVSGKAARAESRQTSLVRQFGQRVVLVHEL